MINDIVTIAANLCRMYIIYQFASLFLNVWKAERKKQIICYGIFFVVNSILFLIYHSPLMNLIVNLIGVYILYTVLYEGTISRRILAVGTMYFFSMAADMIVVIPMNLTYEPGNSITVLSSVLSLLVTLILEVVCGHFINYNTKISSGDIVRFLSIPVCSIVMNGIAITQHMDNKILIITLALGTLLINTIVLYYYKQIQAQYEREYHQQLLELQVEEYESQLLQTEQSYQEIRSMKHEINHFIGSIEGLLKLNSEKDIREIVGEMKKKVSNYEMIAYSGNVILDSILNYNCRKAEKEGAYIEIDIKIPDSLELKPIDMNIILGNLLENAIEAVKNTSNKTILLKMNYEKGLLFLHISNHYDGKLNINKGQYLTTKSDKKNHGIGLDNVKRSVEKYGGELEIIPIEFEFRINILIPCGYKM